MSSNHEVLLVVSVDTEEDNWVPTRTGITVENIRTLKRLSGFFDELHVRATYFTTYQVAIRPRAVDTLLEICDGGRAEIGTHLHPWNTPPAEEPLLPRNTIMKNLAPKLQLEKLKCITDALGEAFGAPPVAFRAGRFGLGPDAVSALITCGYQVDSSVTPFVSWKKFDDGPSFVGAPLGAYRLAPDRDVTRPAPGGGVLEIPLSCGFSRGPFGFWDPACRVLEAAPFRELHLAGLAARTGLVKRIALSPELASVADMLTLSRRLLERGVRHLHLSWHSPSLKPGLSPFTATAADVARLYASVEAYLERLSYITSLTFATVSEAAAVLAERALPRPSREAAAC